MIDSDWYQTECGKLADKGLTVLASNWVYGERELMTKTKVVTPADIKGKKIRLANSQIYVEGFNALGATAVPMALGDVYTLSLILIFLYGPGAADCIDDRAALSQHVCDGVTDAAAGTGDNSYASL